MIEPMPHGALRDEVVELAQGLLRIDTSNPPGNETPAAELIAAHLRAAGVECELVGPDPERLNLVARVPGAGTGPSIMLLAHTDVVPAPSDGWTVPPFAATLADGRLIGRGAVDMKNELAARVVAVAALARSGARPDWRRRSDRRGRRGAQRLRRRPLMAGARAPGPAL